MQEDKGIVGYLVNGKFYCFYCGEGVKGQKFEIYDGEVWDYIPLCSSCSEPILVEPTDDALEKLASFVGVRKGDEFWISEEKFEVLRQFLQETQHVGLEWLKSAIVGGFLKAPKDFNADEFLRRIFNLQ